MKKTKQWYISNILYPNLKIINGRASKNNINIQEMYDTVFPEKVKFCTICSNKSMFINYSKGYSDSCSQGCRYTALSLKNKKTNKECLHCNKLTTNQKDFCSAKCKNNKEIESYNSLEQFVLYSTYNKDKAFLKKYKLNGEYVYNILNKSAVKHCNLHNIKFKFISVRDGYSTCKVCANIEGSITRKENYRNTVTEKAKIYMDNMFIKEHSTLELSSLLNVSCSYITKYMNEINKTSLLIQKKTIVEQECSAYVYNSITNTRTVISPLELDIYSEKHNFAVEYNGLMFHSEGNYSKGRIQNFPKNKHLLKTTLCEEKEIQLFHIFENEWLNPTKKDIWISILEGKQNLHAKIGARKCYIKEISSLDAKVFLEENHLQGVVNGSIRVGLYYKEELVSLMTFGKARMSKKYEYELLRFCTKKNTVVQGGGSRLIKYFEEEYKPKSLVSYANRRWSIGNFYEKVGFTFSHNSIPNFFHFHNKTPMKLESRQKYQKHKLKDTLDNFNPKLTAKENMFLNGYRRIFDSGNKIYIKEYT